MTTNADVTIAEIIEVARRKLALLTPETAGYLVLEAIDQVAISPVLVDEHLCCMQVDGGRVSMLSRRVTHPLDAERGLRLLLRRLLEVSSGRAPALTSVASLPPKGDLAALVAELESALIPLNRGAASRALSRLARETLRARRPSSAPGEAAPTSELEENMAPAAHALGDDTEPMQVGHDPAANFDRDSQETLDRYVISLEPSLPRFALDSSADASDRASYAHGFVEEATTSRRDVIEPRGAPTSPENVQNLLDDCLPSDRAGEPIFSSYPPSSARGVDELLQEFLTSTSRKQDRVAEDLRKMVGVDPPETHDAVARAAPRAESPFPNAGGATDFYTNTPPPRAATSALQEIAHDEATPAPQKRRGVYAAFAAVIVVASGGVALFQFESGFLSGRTPTVVEQERRAAAEAKSAAAVSPPQACHATLVVTDVPQGAELLVRSGLAPVDVERMPSGARLEFIALADGYVPRRAVVPQGVSWDAENGRRRFELPIQLEKSRAKSGALDPWPSAEPGTVVGGQGAPGTVHVVTSPRGAEVWMVVGGGPEAKLELLPCGAGMELLVAGTQAADPLRRRLHVEASRLTPEPSANIVTSRISAAK